MDSPPAAAHPFGAHFVRPNRAAPRFVNPLRGCDARHGPPTKTPPYGRHCCWWRWWESNPRPQDLRYELYMLIPSLISPWATRRAGKTHSQFSKDLTDWTLNTPAPRSYVGDSWDPDA